MIVGTRISSEFYECCDVLTEFGIKYLKLGLRSSGTKLKYLISKAGRNRKGRKWRDIVFCDPIV